MTMTAEHRVPAIIPAGDSARTRRSDPLPSHVAGDKSQETVKRVADAVMTIVRREGAVGGTELNRLYRIAAEKGRYPLVHWDSPRKRAGELVKDGFLVITNEGDPRGVEHEYALAAFSEAVAA
jgi:hypothetical protein